MIFIVSQTKNPYINLATEEFLLKKYTDHVCFLYINSPSIIIGKHQNAVSEANIEFSTKNKIPIIRRISGGGTVYHDYGNLNFCFISNGTAGNYIDFKTYTKPIVDFLETYGIKIQYQGSNNLTINGVKISGNAEHIYKNRVLHHGTLLFNTNLENLQNSLRPLNETYSDKSIKSIPWKVGNIQDFMPYKTDIKFFTEQLSDYLVHINNADKHTLSYAEQIEIETIAEKRYKTWEWTYAHFNKYSFSRIIFFKDSRFIVNMEACKGILTNIQIKTDEQDIQRAKTIVSVLTNTRHSYEYIYEKLKSVDFIKNLPELDLQQFALQFF